MFLPLDEAGARPVPPRAANADLVFSALGEAVFAAPVLQSKNALPASGMHMKKPPLCPREGAKRRILARPKGFEPLTYRLGGDRSILLSYGRIMCSFPPGRGGLCPGRRASGSGKTRLTARYAHLLCHEAAGLSSGERRFRGGKRRRCVKVSGIQHGGWI